MVKEHLKRCSVLILEANHDPTMLETGPYPWYLKQHSATGPVRVSMVRHNRSLQMYEELNLPRGEVDLVLKLKRLSIESAKVKDSPQE